MRRFLRYGMLASVAMILAATAVHAQFTVAFRADEGIPTGRKVAQDSLGDPNPILTSYSAVVTTIDPFGTSKIEVESGKGDAWIYNFYSPSKRQLIAVGVGNIPLLGGFQGSGSPESIDSVGDIGPGDTTALDITGAYAASDKVYDQIKNEAAFVTYRQWFPGSQPVFMGLSNIPVDSLPLVADPNQPFWTVVWQGPGDTGMVCFVASKTGESHCMHLGSIQAGVREGSAAIATASLAIFPNPAAGTTRVAVTAPESAQMKGAELWLFNERGDRVLNLTASFTANGYSFAEFDAGTLPAGVYFCRAIGANWRGAAPVVVRK